MMETKQNIKSIDHLDTIIKNIDELIRNGFDFNAFMSIALGIEFLGSFSDDKEFDEAGNSETRFGNGLDCFKEKWYQTNKKYLFKEFRGPLIHQYRTSTSLIMTSNKVHGSPIIDHRKKTSTGEYIFVVEQLFADFKEACERFKNKLKKDHSYSKDKLDQDYIQIINYQSPNTQEKYSSTGNTITHIDNTKNH